MSFLSEYKNRRLSFSLILAPSPGQRKSVVPSPPRPRRAEQVPSVLCLDATPERDAAPQSPACLCAPPRSHPQESGPLLHVPAHPLPEGEGALSRLRVLIDRE